MEQARKALLVGVGQVPAAAEQLEPLDEAVTADLRLLSSALDASGYEVRTLHNAGLSQMRSMIYEVARDIPEGGVLLLYFTGHGLRVGRTDYLVPADTVPPADGNWQEPYLDSLLPANISPLLKDCAADTVLWLIDACRSNLPSSGGPFGNGVDSGPPNSGFAVLTGCSAGERSGYTGEGSFFTRGLAHALGPMTPARTVEEVFAAACGRTREAALRHGLTQTPRVRYGTHGEARTREMEICGGRPLLEAWQEAVEDTPLWGYVAAGDIAHVPAFKEALRAFVEQCARTVHLAHQRLPHADPWADDTFPVRVLCDRLPLLLPKDASLSALEAVTLIAAPLLREVAWAERLSHASEIDPYSPERRPDPQAHRRHYEQIAEQHHRIARKVSDCRSRGRTEDMAAVAMWLVHRWIADRCETDDEAVPIRPSEALATGLGVTDGRVHELSEMLRAAASGMGLDEQVDETWSRPRKVLLPGGHQSLRLRPLVALLQLAAMLALDVRRLPVVVAEHLAVTDPVLPQQVVALAHGLSWHRDGDALHLDAPSPHQAVHAVLAEVAGEADELVARTLELAHDLRESEAELLGALPLRVTDRDLRPQRVGNQDAYEVPLLRFHLAQTEVRELLMGEQLYGGEPELALREMYQNAMDACRYRAMRWAYLSSSCARPADWSGRIVFTQGRDERGLYVECRDNGVGMSREQLKQTFTRAGSRFERSKSFRKEQSRWLRHDPALRLYPNSRFGIGVFSYFMLAEEMTVVTRQVSPDGIPAEHALRVDIPSSGSLLRIQRHDGSDDGLAEGGTRVRLYLRDSLAALSCVSVLRNLVRVSEFALEAREHTGLGHVWDAGVLQPLPGADAVESLEAVPGALWWVTGRGAVLCDGVMTDQDPFGYVVNLTGPHAGSLSVNRKELQDFDAEWVADLWRRGAQKLRSWPNLSLSWLGRLDDVSRSAARVLAEVWRGKGVSARGWDDESMSLDTVGWFHLDRGLLETSFLSGDQVRYAPWRAAVLDRVLGASTAPPLDLAGHAVPMPGDAELLRRNPRPWTEVVAYAAEQDLTPADVQRRRRRLRIVHWIFGPLPTSGPVVEQVPDDLDRSLAESLGNVGAAMVVDGDGSRHWGGLILASVQHALPLGTLVRRLHLLAPLLPARPPEIPPHHENRVCTQEDVDSMFLRDSSRIARGASVHWLLADEPAYLDEIHRKTGKDPTELLRRLAEFSWLGWTPPSPDEVAAWTDLTDELHDVVSLFTSQGPDDSRTLRWAATLDYADTLEVGLKAAEQQLATVADRLGLTYQRRYTDDCAVGRFVPSPDAAHLVRNLVEWGGHLEHGVDLADLALAYKGWSEEFSLERAVDDLREAGVTVPDHVAIIVEWDDLSLRDRYILSGKEASMDEEDYPAADITSAMLLDSAGRLNESLRDVWAVATKHAERFGLTVPPLPDDLADFRPSDGLTRALIRHPDDGRGSLKAGQWRRLTPLRLASYARQLAVDAATAYERLWALRPLGAPLPELTTEALDTLRHCVPDPYDLVALDDEHRLTPPEAPYEALDVVSIAGRLGEPLPRTVQRISPYLPLCPGADDLPLVPDVIPFWQDLALLSQNLDGMLPALTGRVTRRHIALAADATDESEVWILDRLRLYAPMFGLVVDEDESDG
ncbi:caspase family protein [Streptomyces sp. NPDC012935]|uniref:HD domain-containing protein n=1 Tax=Streptomyces sp. NPDC012935 TaxID=3364857 RepID=UPI0036A43E99